MEGFGLIMEKYTGSGDPKAWINTYLNSLDTAGIPQSSRHVYFSNNLVGPALKWYVEEVHYSDKPYWDKLRAAFEAKWTPPSIASSVNSPIHSAHATSSPSDDAAAEKLYHLAVSAPNSPLGKLYKRAFEEGIQKGVESESSKGTTRISTRTTPPAVKNTSSVYQVSNATQTNSAAFTATSQARVFVEKGINTHLAPTSTISIQTSTFIPTPAITQSEYPNRHLKMEIAPTNNISPPPIPAIKSPTDSVLDPMAPDKTQLMLETALKTSGLTHNHPKSRKSVDFNQEYTEIAKSRVLGRYKRADHAKSLPITPQNPTKQLPDPHDLFSLSPPASNIGLQKCTPFTSSSDSPTTQPSAMVLVPTASATAVLYPETPSMIADFAQNQPEMQESIVFDQKQPKSPVLEGFSWAEDANSLPLLSTTPSKHPRDLSCLRSSSTNPFSSLCRRRRKYKNSSYFSNFRFNPNCQHILSNSCYHISVSHTPCHSIRSHPPLSLDWDQDPRLADLSKALQALGWVHR